MEKTIYHDNLLLRITTCISTLDFPIIKAIQNFKLILSTLDIF